MYDFVCPLVRQSVMLWRNVNFRAEIVLVNITYTNEHPVFNLLCPSVMYKYLPKYKKMLKISWFEFYSWFMATQHLILNICRFFFPQFFCASLLIDLFILVLIFRSLSVPSSSSSSSLISSPSSLSHPSSSQESFTAFIAPVILACRVGS